MNIPFVYNRHPTGCIKCALEYRKVAFSCRDMGNNNSIILNAASSAWWRIWSIVVWDSIRMNIWIIMNINRFFFNLISGRRISVWVSTVKALGTNKSFLIIFIYSEDISLNFNFNNWILIDISSRLGSRISYELIS